MCKVLYEILPWIPSCTQTMVLFPVLNDFNLHRLGVVGEQKNWKNNRLMVINNLAQLSDSEIRHNQISPNQLRRDYCGDLLPLKSNEELSMEALWKKCVLGLCRHLVSCTTMGKGYSFVCYCLFLGMVAIRLAFVPDKIKTSDKGWKKYSRYQIYDPKE